MANVKYKRVVLKLSGEALAGDLGTGINPPEIRKVAEEIKEVHNLGVQITIVVGGGNMWRGESGARWVWNVPKLIILECLQRL
ncbi:uridylate kinase [Liquorilactobacillus sucicola DSM 21376 = JCM 15457]|nr:uridylate kinase [Liquorilactobacillus sucicola DSM 21376 = JCM 15457]